MTLTMPEFEVGSATVLNVRDDEIASLLRQVYVAGGYTTAAEAISLFEPSAVRERGVIIAARERQHSSFAGMVILVPPDSPARRLSDSTVAELHLLGVRDEYRGCGLGRMLVGAAIKAAALSGYLKLILWTQLSMVSAQRLYESLGFEYVDNFERNGRLFKVYELKLTL